MTDNGSDQATRKLETVVGQRRNSIAEKLRQFGRFSNVVRLALFGVIALFVTVSTVALDWSQSPTILGPGEIARETYKAPFATSYVSTIRTEDQRKAAHDSVANIVQTHDESIKTTQIIEAEKLLANIAEIRDGSGSEAQKTQQVFELTEDLTLDEANRIVRMDSTAWGRTEAEVTRILGVSLDEPIRTDEIELVRAELPMRASTQLTANEQAAATNLARMFVRPNVFIDDRATEQMRQEAANAVEPVVVTVQDGQAIVRDGDIVTRTDVEMLEALGLFSSASDGPTRLGKAGMMAILTFILVGYLYAFGRQIWEGRQLLLLGIVLLMPVVAARFFLPHDDVQYMFPAALSAMLVAILLSFPMAAIVSIILAFYLGVVTDLSFELTAVYFVGAVTGAFVIHKAERTMTFIWSGVAVAIAMFLTAYSFRLLDGPVSSGDTFALLVQTAIAGALAASVTFLSFSVLGTLFGITTHLQLLDLLRPNQPLLNRLAREAPGTYHHSIIVSNLAESAVTIVGGDALLARVAVLYHDIGKLEHPTFFIENQANIDNVHDHLDPKVSARVLFEHVSDGYELGKKARLPKPILDIIQQHHGTTLVQFFYTKALNAGMDVTEEEFRYPGPKPQGKEAAIVMLADSVEAAVRSMAQSGRLFDKVEAGDRRSESDRLREFVQNIIDQRVTDGQLSDCDLTMRDIEAIRTTFVQILEGIYHPRVEYPAEVAPAGVDSSVPAVATT
jgi:cyclic-di-AMP phosphodiesterase PgpH